MDAVDAKLALRNHRPVIGRANNRCVYVSCLFHAEKTPSCRIRLDTLRWWCFGCQQGGGARSFLARLVGLEVAASDDEVADIVRGWVADGLRDRP